MRPLYVIISSFVLAGSLTGCTAKDDSSSDTSGADADTDTDTDTDSDADADSDTDTDADTDVFEVAWWDQTLKFGMVKGELATVELDREEVVPIVTYGLYEDDFTIDFDERYACYVNLQLDSFAPGSEEPKAWFDWEFESHFLDTTCTNLDPEVFGKDIGAYFQEYDLEVAANAVDDNLVGRLEKCFLDYEKYAQYFFGANVYLDGDVLSDNGQQYFFGLINMLDDGEVRNDFYDGTAAAKSPDGYYWIGSTAIWGWRY